MLRNFIELKVLGGMHISLAVETWRLIGKQAITWRTTRLYVVIILCNDALMEVKACPPVRDLRLVVSR